MLVRLHRLDWGPSILITYLDSSPFGFNHDSLRKFAHPRYAHCWLQWGAGISSWLNLDVSASSQPESINSEGISSVAHCAAARSLLRSLTCSDAELGSVTIAITSEPGGRHILFWVRLQLVDGRHNLWSLKGHYHMVILLGKRELSLESLEIFMFRSKLDFSVSTVAMTFGPLNLIIKRRLFFR